MRTITPDPNLVAYCGLYCGSCKKYLNEKCPGCHENSRAAWCKIRSCNLEHGYKSCADCTEFKDPRECRKFNNFISKIFALIYSSDRPACIERIRENGYPEFARYMAENRLQTIRKN